MTVWTTEPASSARSTAVLTSSERPNGASRNETATTARPPASTTAPSRGWVKVGEQGPEADAGPHVHSCRGRSGEPLCHEFRVGDKAGEHFARAVTAQRTRYERDHGVVEVEP